MSIKKRRGLGRGLDSLIPNKRIQTEEDTFSPQVQTKAVDDDKFKEEANNEIKEKEIKIDDKFKEEVGDEVDNNKILMISPDLIEANPMQPRSQFEKEAMEKLIDSIQSHGILQPLIVTQKEDGRYQLIIGERRLRAAKELNLSKVPVIVREADREKKLELALVENIIREDLNPIEKALAYKRLTEEFGLTHGEVGKMIGETRSSVSNFLRLLRLPLEIQEGLREGKITETHGMVIDSLDTEEKKLYLYRKVVKEKLTVARTRREVEKLGGAREGRIKIDPRDEEMSRKLRQYLGTKVEIFRIGFKGKITIFFFNYDELIEIVNKIIGTNEQEV